jgi:putative effector of murein hydrolase
VTAAATSLLIEHPLFGLVLTIGVYLVALRAHAALGKPALLHPVLTSVAVVALVTGFAGLDYARYFEQAAPLHGALSVFVVLLAVPLVRQAPLLRAAGSSLCAAILLGCFVAILTATALPMALGAGPDVVASLAPKSATAPVAVGISEKVGGIVGLTAMMAVLTGLTGAVVGPWLLAVAGVRDERAAGFALGVVAHAIGTARAFQISETAGAFASLGMVINALLTVSFVPVALRLLQV